MRLGILSPSYDSKSANTEISSTSSSQAGTGLENENSKKKEIEKVSHKRKVDEIEST